MAPQIRTRCLKPPLLLQPATCRCPAIATGAATIRKIWRQHARGFATARRHRPRRLSKLVLFLALFYGRLLPRVRLATLLPPPLTLLQLPALAKERRQ